MLNFIDFRDYTLIDVVPLLIGVIASARLLYVFKDRKAFFKKRGLKPGMVEYEKFSTLTSPTWLSLIVISTLVWGVKVAYDTYSIIHAYGSSGINVVCLSFGFSVGLALLIAAVLYLMLLEQKK